MKRFETVLEENYDKWKDREYLFEKVKGVYKSVTYGEFLLKSQALSYFLNAQGISGKKIILYGDNSIRLMMADLAVLTSVGISVWVSKEWPIAKVMETVEFLQAECIIYGPEKAGDMEEMCVQYPNLLYLSTVEFEDIWNEHLEKSYVNCDDGETDDDSQCCKIVFSSGTTSSPKAVMLSKKNIFAGIPSLYKRCPFHENDVDYLFLPLNHTYGGIYNFLYSLVFGFSIYLCSDVTVMAQEILEVQPTLFCGVPLIYRRFYEGYGENIGKAFGGRIKYLFCGGARFDDAIRIAYKDSGLNMMEAYALSETASTFSIQYPYDEDIHTVGTIAEDLDVKIIEPDENGCGEIVVKGDNVFLGYAGNEEASKRAFTADGYFRTGDLGYMLPDEEHGGYRLYLTGRMKKQLVLENGEIVEPGSIETLIMQTDSNISKALLYAKDGKLACHLYLKEMVEKDWDKFFEAINGQLPGYEKIRIYDVVLDSVEVRLKQE